MRPQSHIAVARHPPLVPKAPVRWTLPGFAGMTRIACSFADVHAAALRKRDLVRTRHGEFLPITWLKRFQLDHDFLSRHPDAQPVMIRAHALAPNLPDTDILVSPGQMLAPILGRLARPTRAGDLLDHPGIFRQPETGLSYTVFHLGEPAEVRVAGLWFQVGGASTTH